MLSGLDPAAPRRASASRPSAPYPRRPSADGAQPEGGASDSSSSSSADSALSTTRPRPTRGRRRARVLGRLHRHVVVDPGGHPPSRLTASRPDSRSASATFTPALSVLADDDHGAVLVDLLHRLGGVLLGAWPRRRGCCRPSAIPRRAGGRAGSGRCPSCGPRRGVDGLLAPLSSAPTAAA